MRSVVTQLGGLVCCGLNGPREGELHVLTMVRSPRAKLECVLCSWRFRIAEHRVHAKALVVQHDHGFVGGRSLDHHVAALPEVISNCVPYQNVTIDDYDALRACRLVSHAGSMSSVMSFVSSGI